MSSTFAPSGFNPVWHPSGKIVANLYEPTVSTNAAIYKGDPVKLDGTTGVVIIAGGNDVILGVFAGCEYVDSNGKPVYSPYWPGSTSGATSIKFWVYDDPLIQYSVQDVGSLAATAIGDSADSVIATGNAYTGVTGSYLSTLTGAGSPNQWRVMGLDRLPDNAWGDTYTRVRVVVAKSQLISVPNAI